MTETYRVNHKEGYYTMLKVITQLQSLVMDKKGATAIEYGLIAAGIAVGISAVVFTFGEDLQGLFSDMGTLLRDRPA